MKDICQRFANKVRIKLSTVYFLYKGQTLEINQTLNNILNECDKNSNRINILVYSNENKNLNNILENSKEIICSKCGNIWTQI
jgi:predicted transcriptional regulator